MPITAALSHPAVRLYGPRRVIGTVFFVLLLAFTALCLFFTVLVTGFITEDLDEYAQLEEHGERVDATISDRRAGEDESGATYYLTYRFEAGNQTIERETEVYEHEYQLHQEGQALTVVYLPDDANTSMAEMVLVREHQVARVSMVIFPLGFLGMPALLFLLWWWIFRRTAAKLRKHGVSTTATITDARRDDRYEPLVIMFDFYATRPDGQTVPISGQDTLTNAAISFSPGDVIKVRYLARKPETFMVEMESLINAVEE